MERLLQNLWQRGLAYLDDEALSMLGPNRNHAMHLLSQRSTLEIHHHTFTFESMLELLQYLFNRYDFRFQLCDVSLGKGLLSEIIFVLRKASDGDEFLDSRARVAIFVERYVEEYVQTTRA